MYDISNFHEPEKSKKKCIKYLSKYLWNKSFKLSNLFCLFPVAESNSNKATQRLASNTTIFSKQYTVFTECPIFNI